MMTGSGQLLSPCSEKRSRLCSSKTQPSQVDPSLGCKHGSRFFLRPVIAQEEAHPNRFDSCLDFTFLRLIPLDSEVPLTSPLGIRKPYRSSTEHSVRSNHLRLSAFACKELSGML